MAARPPELGIWFMLSFPLERMDGMTASAYLDREQSGEQAGEEADGHATAAQASADGQGASQPVDLRFQPFVPTRHAQQQWDSELQQHLENQRRQQRLQPQREWNPGDWISDGRQWVVLPEPQCTGGARHGMGIHRASHPSQKQVGMLPLQKGAS